MFAILGVNGSGRYLRCRVSTAWLEEWGRRGTMPASQRANRPSTEALRAPDRRRLYEQLAARIGGNRACLALARKLLKRSYHILKALGDQALAPVA